MAQSLFQQALYTGNSIPDVCLKYEQLLQKESSNFVNFAHAAKIAEYRQLIQDNNFLSRIRNHFNELYNLIDSQLPNVRFTINGRQKSLISTESKIQKLLSENCSLDLLRDIFAFRVLIFGKTSPELISNCYEAIKHVIEHNVEKGLTLCEASKVIGVSDFDKNLHKDIFIPNQSLIPEQYTYGVKDYIINPKTNGYQSLHACFRASTGGIFEVQVRTFDMHVHAESGDANHISYKKSKYIQDITFDSKKVNIPGYGITPSGEIFDFIGLEKGLEILKRQKTY